jgi:hypothetical protein
MAEQLPNAKSSTQALLSKVSRYEALFELAGIINAATTIESVGEVLAHRLKYIVDVYSWRYICFDGDPDDPDDPDPITIVIDGYRGRADVINTIPASLSDFEMSLWRDRKTRILCEDPMHEALQHLPAHLQKNDLEQISVNTLVEGGKTQALYFFAKRRLPFTDLDLKCLTMVGGFFHGKVHMLWEEQKLRDLERAYVNRHGARTQQPDCGRATGGGPAQDLHRTTGTRQVCAWRCRALERTA